MKNYQHTIMETEQDVAIDTTATTTTVITKDAADNSNNNNNNNNASSYSSSSTSSSNNNNNYGQTSLKIFVTNLRDFDNRKDFKRLLQKHKITFKNCQKRPVRHIKYGFVTFDDEESKQQALLKIPEIVHKGKNLIVSDNVTNLSNSKSAKGSRKREAYLNQQRDGNDNGEQHADKKQRVDDGKPKDIRNQVMPLWNMSYDDQLKQKNQEMMTVLKKIKRKTRKDLLKIYKKDEKNSGMKAFDRLPTWVQSRDFEGRCCEYKDICPSPVEHGYRNKCEFTVGKDKDGKVTVGFRLGSFGDTLVVAKPNECSVCPPHVLKACELFNNFLVESKFPPYDYMTHQGTWRQMTVKFSSTSKHMMIILQINIDMSNPPMHWLEEVEKLKLWFKNGGDENVWKSFFIQYYTGPSQPSSNDPVEHLYGTKTIADTILNLDFKMSPNSFFQINTEGANKLYSIVSDFCTSSFDKNAKDDNNNNQDSKVTIVDVCCGTGTIGICVTSKLGDKVNKLIGVEMCESAVEDAIENAKHNNISNAEFIASKAEDVLGKMLLKITSTSKKDDGNDNSSSGSSSIKNNVKNDTKVVAIVDPPRAGLHPSVIHALRTCRAIDCLVYVSCNPKGSFIEDIYKLCLPKKRNVRGFPYKPIRATSVDMFPQSNHCEIVMQLEHDFSGLKK